MKSDLFSVTQKNIRACYRKGVLVDTGPLLLLILGCYNYDLIGKLPLTEEFTKNDFDLLDRFLNNFKTIVITPQILAEISNHINTKLPKNHFSDFIEKTISAFHSLEEDYVGKNLLLSRVELKKIGFTDMSILLSCEKEGYLILTKDLKFEGICLSQGLPVIHFDKLRASSWTF